MGAQKKKGDKGSQASDKTLEKTQASIKEAASGLLDEVERTGGALVTEVKDLFDSLLEKVAGVAAAAAETTASVAQKVAFKDTAKLVSTLLDDIKDAGEASLRTIGDGFDSLREQVARSFERPEKKKKGKSKSKPVNAWEERAVKKVGETTPASQVAEAQRALTQKAASAKKVVSKKAAVAKQVAVKKAVAPKNTIAKKPVAAKGGAMRKTTAKKVAVKKTLTKKPAARKKPTPAEQ